MLFQEHEVNWNDYPTYLKKGSCCYKENDIWKIDFDMTILKGEDRDFLEKLVITTEV